MTAYAEIIQRSSVTPISDAVEAIVVEWLASPSDAAIIEGDFTHNAIAVYPGRDGKSYYAQLLTKIK